jgi:para-nitrobenzyl esterase
VRIENGVIEGLYDTNSGLQLYLGIPFAMPLVGNLRWTAPPPPDNWREVKSTNAFGPRAVQTIVWGDMNSRSNGINEDCLYLNVWTPAKKNAGGLPVLVYFYGGGCSIRYFLSSRYRKIFQLLGATQRKSLLPVSQRDQFQ